MFLDLKLNNYSAGHFSTKDNEKEQFLKREKKKLINVEEYLLDRNKLLDADKIQKEIFPILSADVFISHAHADEDGAIEIAIALEKIGLNAFVDSCVWGYADQLLRKVDDEFCIPDGWTSYDYNLRNRTTTNVHMILNSALQGMIDSSELLIFLDSKNSVKVGEYIEKKYFLSSPWIHSELMFASRVRRRERRKITLSNENFEFRKATASNDIDFAYSVPPMTKSMDFIDFARWINDFKKNRNFNNNMPEAVHGLQHLDQLYRQLGVDNDYLKQPRMIDF